MRSRRTYLALTGALSIGLVAPGLATDPASDSVTFYAVAQPQVRSTCQHALGSRITGRAG